LRGVIVFHLGGVSGPSRSLTGLAAWLAERGELGVLVPEGGEASATYARHGDVAVVPYETLTHARGPRALLRAARAFRRDVATFRRELRRRRAELVVVVTTALPAALAAARLERVPAVVYAAEVLDQRWKRTAARHLWARLLASATVALADGVVCCSQLVARQFPRARTPLAVAYPPILPEHARGDRRRGRERWGVGAGDPLLVVVGNLSRGRGQDVAIRALPGILREAPRARLLLVGRPHPRPVDVAYAAELECLADAIGVGGAVRFAGEVRDIADVLAAADVVVNPARADESFGRVAAEALAARRPVVSSDVGAVREVIRDGVDGLLVPRDRPDAIADAVVRLLSEPAEARRLAEAGAARVASEFGPGQDLAAWRRIVCAVAGASAR
jgi:glycosyltransferase involved in cell wall biosynthesis